MPSPALPASRRSHRRRARRRLPGRYPPGARTPGCRRARPSHAGTGTGRRQPRTHGRRLGFRRPERNLIIGNVEALPASLFPEQIAYVALGHLHKPQKVAGQERIRYSGSPLPLSFAEVNYRHQVLLVTLEGERLKDVQSLPVPRAVELLRIGPAPLGEVLDRIGELAEADLLNEQRPWLEVRVMLDQPQPDLRQQVESALLGKACRLVRIASEYQRRDEEQARCSGSTNSTPRNCSAAPGKRLWLRPGCAGAG